MSEELLNISFYGEAPSTPTTSKMYSLSRNQEVPMTPILGKVQESSPFQIVPFTHNDSLGTGPKTPSQEVTPSQSLNRSFQVAPSTNESLVSARANVSTPCRTPVLRHPKMYDHFDNDQMVPSSVNKSSITFNPCFAKPPCSSSNYFSSQINQKEAQNDNFIQQQEKTKLVKQTNGNSQDQGSTTYDVKVTTSRVSSSRDKTTVSTFDNIGSGDGLGSVQIEANGRDIESSSSGRGNLQVQGIDICAESTCNGDEATTSSQLSVRNEITETSSQQSVKTEKSSTFKTKPLESTRIKRILLSSLGGCGDNLNQLRKGRAKTQKKTVKKKVAALFDDILLADSDEEMFDRSNKEGL